MAEVYRTLLDIEKRSQWVSSVLEIEHDSTVPRLGFVHVCLLEGMSVEFQTVGSEVGESEIVYVEEGWIKELDLVIRETFRLVSLDSNRTEVTLGIHWPDSEKVSRDVKTRIL